MLVFLLTFLLSYVGGLLWQEYAMHGNKIALQKSCGRYTLSVRPHWELLGGIIALLPFFLTYSMQYSMHSDYDNYEVAFYAIKAGHQAIRDPAVLFINQVVADANLPFQFVLIAIYLISFAILGKCICDYSQNFATSLLLFPTLFFTLGFLQIRQLVAVVIVFFAYRYIYKRKFIAFVLTVLIATTFHSSAIIMLPFYFILNVNLKASYYMMIFGMGAGISLFQNQLLEWVTKRFMPQYYGRHEMYRNTVFNKIDIAVMLIVMALVLLYYVALTKKKDINRIFINAFFVQVFIFFFCRWIPELDRLAYYFYFPCIALIPNLIESDSRVEQRNLIQVAIPLVLLILFLLSQRSNTIFLHYVSIFS